MHEALGSAFLWDNLKDTHKTLGLPGSSVSKEPPCRFNRWVIPWRRNGSPLHILAWKSLWTEEPGGLQSMGSQELDMTWQLNDHHHHHHKILNHPFRVFLKLFKGLQRFIGAVRISFGLIVGQG